MKHQAACVLVYPSTRQVNWFVGIRLGQLVVYILQYTPLSYTPDVLLSYGQEPHLQREIT